MSFTFTPGPWHLRTSNGNLPVVREIKLPNGEHSTYRAVVGHGNTLSGPIVANLDFGYGQRNDEANAYLIAAAPFMYEALQYVVKHTTDPILERTARAALLKANGEA